MNRQQINELGTAEICNNCDIEPEFCFKCDGSVVDEDSLNKFMDDEFNRRCVESVKIRFGWCIYYGWPCAKLNLWFLKHPEFWKAYHDYNDPEVYA